MGQSDDDAPARRDPARAGHDHAARDAADAQGHGTARLRRDDRADQRQCASARQLPGGDDRAIWRHAAGAAGAGRRDGRRPRRGPVDPRAARPAAGEDGARARPGGGRRRSPATSSGDACGIVAVGLGRDGHGYVLEDASEAGLSPEGWAARVAGCARRNRADRVVAERNQGGDMVDSVLRLADPTLPVHLVYASIGKAARAEPVSFLYAQGRVWHSRGFRRWRTNSAGWAWRGPMTGPAARRIGQTRWSGR